MTTHNARSQTGRAPPQLRYPFIGITLCVAMSSARPYPDGLMTHDYLRSWLVRKGRKSPENDDWDTPFLFPVSETKNRPRIERSRPRVMR
jgi:hypothetical protein